MDFKLKINRDESIETVSDFFSITEERAQEIYEMITNCIIKAEYVTDAVESIVDAVQSNEELVFSLFMGGLAFDKILENESMLKTLKMLKEVINSKLN